MPYLIDGHNLIGQLPDINLDEEHDEAKLVQKLRGYAARTGKQFTVVFDAGLPGGRSRMSNRAVQVVFASGRSNADRVMLERINKIPDPKNWTVVSGDNEVLSAARRRRMATLSSVEFAALLRTPPPKSKPGLDVAVDVRLTEDEIAEWLEIFGGDEGGKSQ